MRTEVDALRTCFDRKLARVVLEVGTHSPWVSRTLQGLGHEVIVATPRRLRFIWSEAVKTDRARPDPVIETIAAPTQQNPCLRPTDRATVPRSISRDRATPGPERGRGADGVGLSAGGGRPLWIQHREPWERISDCGQRDDRPASPILSSVLPRREMSCCGACWWARPTTSWVRSVQDCELRRWGLQLAARGGRCAKRRAAVAVARKLAVLLHRLWVSRHEYEPFHSHVRRRMLPAPA